MAESLNGRGLDASLTVRDIAKSLAWYRDVLGFTVDREFASRGQLRAVSLRAGQARVLIGQDDGAQGWDRVKGLGISLRITTDQSIDELARRIRESGGTLESEPADSPFGARFFRIVDLDGFRFTISTENRPVPQPADTSQGRGT